MAHRTRSILQSLLCLLLCLGTARCSHQKPRINSPPTLDNIDPALPPGVAIILYRGLIGGDRAKLQSCIEVDTPGQADCFDAICDYAVAVADLRAAVVKQFGSDGGVPRNLTDSLAAIPHSRTVLTHGSVIIVTQDGDSLAAMVTVNHKWKVSLPMQAMLSGRSLDELTEQMERNVNELDQYRAEVEAGKFESAEQLADVMDGIVPATQPATEPTTEPVREPGSGQQ